MSSYIQEGGGSITSYEPPPNGYVQTARNRSRIPTHRHIRLLPKVSRGFLFRSSLRSELRSFGAFTVDGSLGVCANAFQRNRVLVENFLQISCQTSSTGTWKRACFVISHVEQVPVLGPTLPQFRVSLKRTAMAFTMSTANV